MLTTTTTYGCRQRMGRHRRTGGEGQSVGHVQYLDRQNTCDRGAWGDVNNHRHIGLQAPEARRV